MGSAVMRTALGVGGGGEAEGVLLGRAQITRERDDAREPRRRRGGRGEFEHALEAVDVEHPDRERGDTHRFDALGAVALDEAEQRVDPPHAGPGQRDVEQGMGVTADRFAVAGGLRLEECDVATCVGALRGGKVVGIGRAPPRQDARMGLDQHQPVVEADRRQVGARHQSPADPHRRQRVERPRDLSVLITCNLGLAPQRHVVTRGGRGEQVRPFVGLEVLARQAVGGRVATHAVLVLAPVAGMGAGHLQVLEVLASEAVVTHVPHRALGARLVARMAGAGGIDLEAARLGVFEEGAVDVRLEWVGVLNDGLGAVGDQRAEHAPVELPGRLARFDRARRRLSEAGIDEPIARHMGREDPGAQPAASAPQIGLEVMHPAGVDLELVAGLAIGDRDRGGRTAEAELSDREAPQRRIGQLDTAPSQQPTDLRKSDAALQARRDELALPGAHLPGLAPPAAPVRLQGGHDRRDLLFVGRLSSRTHPAGLGCPQVAPHRLDVEAELGSDPLLRSAAAPQPEDFLDLQHRDLAIAHGSLLPVRAGGVLAAWSRGGNGSEKLSSEGGNGSAKLAREGSHHSEN